VSLPATATPSHRGSARRGIRATDGCSVTLDGREVLHVGARPAYRADVDTSLRAVFVIADGRALELRCQAAGDGANPERPGPRFGWTASRADRERAEVPVRAGQVLTACLQDRDAVAAVAQITRSVADEARRVASGVRAGALPGAPGAELRSAADAWYRVALQLDASLETAARLRRVPVRPLRDEFLRQRARGEVTAAVLGARVGWHWRASPGRRTHGDSARVLRRLGLSVDPSDRRPTRRRRRASPAERALLDDLDDVTATMSYDVAVKLCRGLRRDPADFGWL
jgi:hypothetical protein